MSSPNPDQSRQTGHSLSLGARVRQFIGVEALSGLVLLGAAALALAWANSPWAAHYFALWDYVPVPGLTAHARPVPLRLWINDGLMSVFFFVVGLEIRREMHNGALCNLKLATLPLLAAIGGVTAPALIYMYFNQAPLARGGWAVPTATDIAFAVGVLALLGKRVPNALRVLLLAIAIIDDIIAVLIIAFFYADGIALRGVAIALAGCALVLIIQRTGQRKPMDFGVPALIIWYGMLSAHIHPAIAGVVLGLLTPMRDLSGSPVERLEAALHPWVAYGVMPVFAFANAGVNFGSGGSLTSSVSLGVIAGLVLGKPLGILFATRVALAVRCCALPAGVEWRGLVVLGMLAGIGFTMAIFVANLAFPSAAMLAEAKLAVMSASLLAAILGLGAGYLLLPPVGRTSVRHSPSAPSD
ncbi:MAG: Na+/H+ antiporter NhaA [Proteobacteria bacterium]|nr:Na+/H+ antiporter NhaA [Pseudomonadota bacterium]